MYEWRPLLIFRQTTVSLAKEQIRLSANRLLFSDPLEIKLNVHWLRNDRENSTAMLTNLDVNPIAGQQPLLLTTKTNIEDFSKDFQRYLTQMTALVPRLEPRGMSGRRRGRA